MIQAEGFDDPEIDFYLAQLTQMQTNDEKKLRERLMETGLQETRARMLTHYYMMHESEQPRAIMMNLKEKLQDRQTEKLRKVWQFKELIMVMTALDNLCYHTFTNSLIKRSARPLRIAALLADLTCLIMKKKNNHWS